MSDGHGKAGLPLSPRLGFHHRRPPPNSWKPTRKKSTANNRLAAAPAGAGKNLALRPTVPVPQAAMRNRPSRARSGTSSGKPQPYDQVFGRHQGGNGDPTLVILRKGQPNTPRAWPPVHASTFLYGSGVLIQRRLAIPPGQHGLRHRLPRTLLFGFTLSYPYEVSDPDRLPLRPAPCGQRPPPAQETFRNSAASTAKTTTSPARANVEATFTPTTSTAPARVKIAVKPNMASLNAFSPPGYRAFPLTTPDVYRARLFREEFRSFERRGTLPNLLCVFLPCYQHQRHPARSPTRGLMVADNDFGRG